MAVVYLHRKLTDGQPFYVGVGKHKSRARHKSRRTSHWKKIVEKYGYTIEVLKEGMSYKEAEELEKILISWYGRMNNGTGILCNFTEGGNAGTLGRPMSKFNKQKLSRRVAQYTLEGVLVKTYDSISQASLETGCNRTNISICANPNNNRRKQVGGFIWKYL